jgi:rod shape-determining protein MreC
MFRFLEGRYKEFITSLLLVVILISVSTSNRLENNLRWYDRAIIFVTAPMQYGLNSMIQGTISFFNQYVILVTVKTDNEFLVAENRKLKEQLNKFRELEFENGRLRQMLAFKEKVSPYVIPAEVFAQDASMEFKTIRINKGEKEGVKIAMPVLNYEGVVGIVLKTSSDFSDVLIVTDPNFAIDAIVQRTRARGIIEGKSGNLSHMKYLNRLDDVVVGDKVVSSGLAGKFPKGIMIGEVIETSRAKYGITQDVLVRPSVNFGKLEEVFVVIDLPAVSAEQQVVN